MADMIEGLVRQPIFVPIPIAVVGFGRMGRRHVEALSRSPEFVLSMVVDSDPARVREARALGLRASTRLADACDVPGERHELLQHQDLAGVRALVGSCRALGHAVQRFRSA